MPNNNDNITTIEETAYIWSRALCECAGFDEEYAERFWGRLTKSTGIYSEFVYYMVNQNFACKYKISDISIVDIMIWQIDHFKASMDMNRQQKHNPDLMLLTAFVTMLDMEDNPQEFVSQLRSDTGTDYPGKY